MTAVLPGTKENIRIEAPKQRVVILLDTHQYESSGYDPRLGREKSGVIHAGGDRLTGNEASCGRGLL
jgi:hypothetical protein